MEGTERKANQAMDLEFKKFIREEERIWSELRPKVRQIQSEFGSHVASRKALELQPLARALAKSRPPTFSYTV